MRFELVYDVASTSEAPRYALLLALIAMTAVLVWFTWLRLRDIPRPMGVGIKLLAGVAVILFLLSVGLRYEQRSLASRADARTVEGPITGLWAKSVRRSGSGRFYWEWEGFWVQGIAFVYLRNLEQNYFHNAGAHALDLRDGMQLRVRYIEERDGETVRNQILRVERAVE